ncbi:MAG: hypothetical protein JWQ29_1332 [Phenylobacterium sp.]|nr:hypothetical protein [Phenylobacterium sp.]
MMATITGSVTGQDNAGYFGAPNSHIDSTFTATYKYDVDTSYGLGSVITYGDPANPSYLDNLNAPGIIKYFRLGINGRYDIVSKDLSGLVSFIHDVDAETNDIYNYINIVTVDTDAVTAISSLGRVEHYNYWGMQMFLLDTVPATIDTAYSSFSRQGQGSQGSFERYYIDYGVRDPNTDNALVVTYYNLSVLPTRVTIVELDPSSTPEPATWAMLIAGFGVTGGALRRRNRLMSAA